MNFKFIDLFAGVGGIRRGFESIGGECIFTSEWNPHSQKTYKANYPNDSHDIYGDITKLDPTTLPDFDLLLAGFPCQAFSLAGKQRGFNDTRGTLFFDVARIIKEKQPKVVFLENVKNLVSHDKGNTFKVITGTLDELGYHVSHRVVNSNKFVPQKRERIYIVGYRKDLFKLEDTLDLNTLTLPDNKPVIKDILEDSVDPKYTLSDKLWTYLQGHAAKHQARGNGFGCSVVDLDGCSRTLSARYHKDGSEVLIPQTGKNPRKLTPRECARLMGYPESFVIPVSDTQAYTQFGNSVVVPVIEFLAKAIEPCFKKALKQT